jgi:hypothetical protein
VHLAAELARPGSPSIIWNWPVPEVSAPSSNFRSVPEGDVRASDPDDRFRREAALRQPRDERELSTRSCRSPHTNLGAKRQPVPAMRGGRQGRVPTPCATKLRHAPDVPGDALLPLDN